MTDIAASPASSGPAGSQFEAEVGATYLLALLNEAEPRGLPGTLIERVEFQRAPEGRALDDVVVHARNERGEAAVLEIQVKRGITFAPKDSVFAEVVAQIARAVARPDFLTTQYQLAVAVGQTTTKIECAYQHVLSWARQFGSAETFMARLSRPGIANEDMRTFVATLRQHLEAAGAATDAESLWAVLRRLQILTFDFTAPGSAAAALARELSCQALASEDAARASSLWSVLVALTLDIAAEGGERTRASLIEDLASQSFRLIGSRRHGAARARLAEDAAHALDDIEDRIAGVRLMRIARTGAVWEALEHGRFVEIRGDAGVGKSGILKYFAHEAGAQSRIIVFAPQRTTPGGWAALRLAIAFTGTVEELLLDLASSGGATLFVDNLDGFSEGERATVRDLVRAAARVPGFRVIATARRTPIGEESDWLPADALDTLGRAPKVVIDELGEAELDELRFSAPHLAPLLAETHPARAVTRNLYRLSRLARLPQHAQLPHTEVEMSDQWWRSAGGVRAEKRRECSRLLRDLAGAELAGATPFDGRGHSAPAIDALIAAEALRELAPDRLVFRHDVLREWAVAQLLIEEPDRLAQLPLRSVASTVLARGIELTARARVEFGADGSEWLHLLEQLSGGGAHGSWRRATLLALVRSEIAVDILTRTSSLLFADNATLLRELVGTVAAVEVEPASKHYAASGIDSKLLAEWHVPRGPAFSRLVIWLLQLRDRLPSVAVPDVADLYMSWCMGMLGQDPLIPGVLAHLYAWLRELEDVDDLDERALPRSLNRAERARLHILEDRMRTCFLQLARRTPHLAVDYLNRLKARRNDDQTVLKVLKSSGSLAECAPRELSELVSHALMPADECSDEYGRREPFDYLDHDFIPASPAQGPFFALLTHAPEYGLVLIDRLAAHAVSFYSRYPAWRDDGITLTFSNGDRTFPCASSYAWSRGTCRAYCLTSALQALEAWAHRRIEAGDSIERVLHDVLRPNGSPACFLLVAVDLLLSHWPKTRDWASPFMTSPLLLCLDRRRALEDQHESPDPLGVKGLLKEPRRNVKLEELTGKTSRRVQLEALLPKFALGDAKQREYLVRELRRVQERLGPSAESAGFNDPAFMLEHALNRLDLSNWQLVQFPQEDGSVRQGWEYLSPEAERARLADLESDAQNGLEDLNMSLMLGKAVDDQARSPPELAEAAAKWARRARSPKQSAAGSADMQRRAVLSAAMISMRDGAAQLRAEERDWALTLFRSQLSANDSDAHCTHIALRHNNFAIAFAGLVFAYEQSIDGQGLREILQVAARADLAVAAGFGAALDTLVRLNRRLPRSVLRCALAGCVRPERSYGLDRGDASPRIQSHRQRLDRAIEAELVWLTGAGQEPHWPNFPLDAIRRRRRKGLRLPVTDEPDDQLPVDPAARDSYVGHNTAAHWLHEISLRTDPTVEPWMLDLVRAYSAWTSSINGDGLDPHEEIYDQPREWNAIYFDLLARSLGGGLSASEIEALALSPVTSLPDQSFYDVATIFLKALDRYFFGEHRIEESAVIAVRTAFAKRLQHSGGWQWLKRDATGSIEIHIGPCIAAMLFHTQYPMQRITKCYLGKNEIEAATRLLPIVQPLIDTAPSLFVAELSLNVFEVSPCGAQLAFFQKAAEGWLATFPEDKLFWLEHGIGARVAAWIEALARNEPAIIGQNVEALESLHTLLVRLVALGVAEAWQAEELLARIVREQDMHVSSWSGDT